MTKFYPKIPKKCPPKDAQPPNGIYFRIILSNPPIVEDFVVWVDEPHNRHRLKEKAKKGDCQAFAMSVFAGKEATLRKIKLFRHAWDKRSALRGDGFLGIAQLELDSTSGLIKQTGKDPSHHDLWPYITSNLEHKVHKIISVKGS